MAGRSENLTGRRFTRLLVTGRSTLRSGNGKLQWLCRCDCGSDTLATSNSLTSGHTKSCGCLMRDHMKSVIDKRIESERNITHGHAPRSQFSRTYQTWRNMINRCELPSDKDYPRYGGRGIKVCPQWRASFETFLANMGQRPDGMTIERTDPNEHYTPGNCAWATRRVQANNRSTNCRLTHDGMTLTVAQWAVRLGLRPGLIAKRVHLGWSDSDALTRPIRRRQDKL
jgi:hypothetical protein